MAVHLHDSQATCSSSLENGLHRNAWPRDVVWSPHSADLVRNGNDFVDDQQFEVAASGAPAQREGYGLASITREEVLRELPVVPT
jgi:hypothetical protein